MATLLISTALLCSSGNATTTDDRNRSGGLCLYIALRSLDVGPQTLEDVERQLGPIGTSIPELKKAAERFGAQSLIVQTNFDRLQWRYERPERFVCIAQMKSGNFVILADITNREVDVIDPPKNYTIPASTFATQWDGNALLLSDELLGSEESLVSGSFALTSPAVGYWCILLLLVLLSLWVWRRRKVVPIS